MASPTRPEPMNASPYHSKVKVALTFSDPLYVAGGVVSGKMEVECRMDKGLGIGVIMVELFAIEELTSRDHSATSTFLHSRRLFQGPGLPPSNAVLPHPISGSPTLPANYYHARKGLTTFMFQLPLPASSPSSISFGSGLARVRYEVRASVGVSYKGENRLVMDRKEVDVVESFEENFNRIEPEGAVAGEGGKIWLQARLVGGIVVAGQPACVELQVKNHSTKKNSGLAVSLTRNLHFPKLAFNQKAPFQLSDTLTSVAFKGPEYVVQPGSEGVANLVFDTPRSARGVKGDLRVGDDEGATLEPLFEVRCIISIKMAMGIGSKDILLDLPVTVLHPLALPSLPPEPECYTSPHSLYQPSYQSPPDVYSDRPTSPYGYLPTPMSPPHVPYVDAGYAWLPPDMNPHSYPYLSPPPPNQHYYHPPPPNAMIPLHSNPFGLLVRPSSAEPLPSQPLYSMPTGLPTTYLPPQPLLPHPVGGAQIYNHPPREPTVEPEEGKGEIASRISHHLRMSTRARSASPPQHRFPLPVPPSSQQVDDSAHQSSQPISIPHTIRKRPSMHLSTGDLPHSPSNSSGGALHSPRPILSPKTTSTVDPFTNTIGNKSERVEILERLAEQVDNENSNMSGSGGILDPLPRVGNEKTLPSPPVPSGKEKRGGIGAALGRRRLEDVFTPIPPFPGAAGADGGTSAPVPIAAAPTSTQDEEKTPPTPTLTAVTPLRFSRSRGELSGLALNPVGGANSGLGAPGGGLSGLDALEARLVAEVGTKKANKDDRRLDVRTVLAMPIDIPISRGRRLSNEGAIGGSSAEGMRTEGVVDAINDSAISSLTLAGDERSPIAVREERGGKTLRPTSRSRSRTRTASPGQGVNEVLDLHALQNVGKERKSEGAKKDKDGRKEGRKMRKAVQGRVAAWLGSIDPDIPPPQVPTPPPTSPLPEVSVPAVEGIFNPPLPAPSKSPLRRPPAQVGETRISSPKDEKSGPEKDVSAAPNPRSSGFVPIALFGGDKLATRKDVPIDGSVTPKPVTPKPGPAQVPLLAKRELKSARPSYPLKFGNNLGVKYPPSGDPAVKYDVKSARGGRGGKVTAVAAIWTSAAQNKSGNVTQAKASKPILNNPAPRRLDFGKVKAAQGVTSGSSSSTEGEDKSTRAKPESGAVEYGRARLVKSSSVPAIVSSSLAIPMLSSTASLARPGDVSAGRERPGKIGRVFGTIPPDEDDGDNQHPSGGSFGVGKAVNSGAAIAGAGLAFGQARLRDLIKKYQGAQGGNS